MLSYTDSNISLLTLYTPTRPLCTPSLFTHTHSLPNCLSRYHSTFRLCMVDSNSPSGANNRQLWYSWLLRTLYAFVFLGISIPSFCWGGFECRCLNLTSMTPWQSESILEWFSWMFNHVSRGWTIEIADWSCDLWFAPLRYCRVFFLSISACRIWRATIASSAE